MRKIFASSLVLLALIAWTTAPAAGAETNQQAQVDLTAQEAPLDEPRVEEPPVTPAEEPATGELVDLVELLELPQNDRQRKIRECTEQEKYVHCGSTACDCIFAGLNFYCFC